MANQAPPADADPTSPLYCHVCRTEHYNACPVLWGGNPERPSERNET